MKYELERKEKSRDWTWNWKLGRTTQPMNFVVTSIAMVSLHSIDKCFSSFLVLDHTLTILWGLMRLETFSLTIQEKLKYLSLILFIYASQIWLYLHTRVVTQSIGFYKYRLERISTNHFISYTFILPCYIILYFHSLPSPTLIVESACL